MNEIIGLIIIGIGLAFDLFGCIGLIRMPNVYCRLQAATKCVTLGTCSILLGVLVCCGCDGAGIKAVICIAIVAATSPTAAHAIARAAHKFGVHVHADAVVDRYDEEVDHHEEGEVL